MKYFLGFCPFKGFGGWVHTFFMDLIALRVGIIEIQKFESGIPTNLDCI